MLLVAHLLVATAAAGAFAALAEVQGLHEGGQSHEDIDDPFDRGPCAEEEVYDVQVLADESADTDETPVESSYENEDPADATDGAAFAVVQHDESGEKNRTEPPEMYHPPLQNRLVLNTFCIL